MKRNNSWLVLVIILFHSCMPEKTTSRNTSTNNPQINNTTASTNTIPTAPSTTTTIPVMTPNDLTGGEIITGPVDTNSILGDLTKLKKKTGFGGNKVIPYPQGYISGSCANYANYNFCVSIYDKNMNLIREITHGPKIPNNSHQTDFTAIMDIAYISTGHIVIAGFTSQPIGEMPADTGGPLTARGDGFVAKYSIDGQYVWLKQFGAQTKGPKASMREEFHSVAVNSSGEIIIAGTTASNFAETHGGKSDALLIKLSASGQILFEKQLGLNTYGNLSNKEEKFVSVMIDQADNIYVGGHTSGNLLETNSAMPNCGYPGAANGECEWSDIMIFSYTKNGQLRWGRQLGKISATGSNSASAKFDFLSQIALGNDNAVYFTGSREVYGDIVVGKLNENGTLAWYRKYLGLNNQKGDSGVSVTVDKVNENLYICATTMGNLFEAQGGGAVSSSTLSSGNGDIVLLKISSINGELTTAKHFGNITLGPDKSKNSEYCGNILLEGEYLTLFGTSESNLFSGNGTQFIARDLVENFQSLLLN
jgi:hypothetical protein